MSGESTSAAMPSFDADVNGSQIENQPFTSISSVKKGELNIPDRCQLLSTPSFVYHYLLFFGKGEMRL
jgi:hypothetical protein